MNFWIILSFVLIMIIGWLTVLQRYHKVLAKHTFAFEFRDNFIKLSNHYMKNYDGFSRTGEVDYNLYVELTEKVNTLQDYLGGLGIMDYTAPFQMYRIPRYQIVINTLPKFRTGHLTDFDISSVDDCLLRYLGVMKEVIEKNKRNLSNPIVWFREGVRQIISLPIYLLNWFGIIGDNVVGKVTHNFLYKLLAGIAALVTFLSGVVTIITGKDQTIAFIKHLFNK